MVPDPDKRERIVDVARQVTVHPEFKRLRNTLWRRLQFRDVPYRDEIERTARSALVLPDAISFVGEPRPEAAASARRSEAHVAAKAADAAAGRLGSSRSGPPVLSEVLK